LQEDNNNSSRTPEKTWGLPIWTYYYKGMKLQSQPHLEHQCQDKEYLCLEEEELREKGLLRQEGRFEEFLWHVGEVAEGGV